MFDRGSTLVACLAAMRSRREIEGMLYQEAISLLQRRQDGRVEQGKDVWRRLNHVAH